MQETSIKPSEQANRLVESSQRLPIDGANRVYFKTRDTDELIWCLSLVLLALLGLYQFWLALGRSPSADDALFLSVPKNWLEGYGWATSYSEKIPFNPDFTGPTALLIPAALLMQLFGNQLWIGNVTGAIINLILLAACLRQLRAYWRHSGAASLFLVCGCIISKPDDFASLVGYYSGSLLLLLAGLMAFNPHYSRNKRALSIGLCAACGLHIKWLLAPAFFIVGGFFLLSLLWRKAIQLIDMPKLLMLLLLPVLVLHGGWQLYKQHALSSYNASYNTAHASYGKNFFLYHGSGVGQWREAPDKRLYLKTNADKNLYFIEESLAEYGLKNPFLGDAPADERHIVGWLVIAVLLGSLPIAIRRITKTDHHPACWFFLTLNFSIAIYIGWYVLFAMAMSPGHFYFQNQWLLWVSLLALSQARIVDATLVKPAIAALLVLLSITVHLHAGAAALQKPEAMQQAVDYIRHTTFEMPLAGCGYGSYPRHLEYLLPASQNFGDCLDMIQDHVELDNGHYRWTSPLSFTLVFSMQSAGINAVTGQVFDVCKDDIIYRNPEVLIFSCSFTNLQKINLDRLMPEIAKEHNWYKTRIQP